MTSKLEHMPTKDSVKLDVIDVKVKPKRNEYRRKSSKIPKSIKMFFLILHLTFGQDFGFGNLFSKKSAEFCKYYSAVLVLMIFVVLLLPFKLVGTDVWYWCTLTECLGYFYILKTTKYTAYNLLCDIHAAERIDLLEKQTFGVFTTLYAISMYLAKTLLSGFFCAVDHNLYCEISSLYFVFYVICFHALDVMHDVQTIIRAYIYAYVKNMELCLKQDQNINEFIERYDKIADCQDNIRGLSDYLILVELVTNVPKLMTSSWYMLHYAQTEHKWFTTMAECVVIFHLAIQIVIPATIAQLIKCRMDHIQQVLNKWRMVQRDPEMNAEIVRVIKYLKGRTLQYKIWGIIPIDLRLPFMLISICITYLIVIVQFTHLYD